MKRGRQVEFIDEEPLSKKINNLHLDSHAMFSSFNNNRMTEANCSSNYMDVDSEGQENTSVVQIIDHKNPINAQSSYPNINLSSNEHYFGINKVLHDLHIEKLKRLGRLY